MYTYIKTFAIVVFIFALALPAVSSSAMAASQAAAASAGAEAESIVAASSASGQDGAGLANHLATVGKRWKGSTAYDIEDGTWKAVVTDRKTGDSYTWGSYGSEREAQGAASSTADALNKNGVVDGPGCNEWPTFIEC